MKELKVRLRHRYNEKDVWNRVNPILEPGEMGIESDTGRFKYGDGKHVWQELEYAYGSGLTSIICETEDQMKNIFSADKYPGAIAILPREYITDEGTFVMDTPYISLRKSGKWIWTVFADSQDKPIVSSVLGAFVLGASSLG